MVLQDRSRAGVGDRTFDHTLDRLSFALIGNDVDDDFALEDLGTAHAESMGGNSIKAGEPAFDIIFTVA